MARPEHEDSKPIFYLEDQSKQLSAVSRLLGRKVRGLYYDERNPANFIPTTYIARHRWQLVKQRKIMEENERKNGEKPLNLDVSLMAFMMDHCARADYREIEKNNGVIMCKFIKVGCRVYATQNEIAEMFRMVQPKYRRETVNKQINLMYDLGIIVNKANSWIEFDVELCWNGRVDLWLAYRKVQRTKYDAVFIMPNGEEVRYKNFMRRLDDYNLEETPQNANEQKRWEKEERETRMEQEDKLFFSIDIG